MKSEFSYTGFKKAVTEYVAYNDALFLRWFKTSEKSQQAFQKMKAAQTDTERFAIAQAYIQSNPKKQLAKSLRTSMPALGF